MQTNLNEKAVLTINGEEYHDWESVMVRHEWMGVPAYRFRFTCSEGMPLAQNFAKLRILPGMTCTITLAGILAFTGLVSTRQVFYDARRHYIEIQGATTAAITATTSPVTKTGEFKNVSFDQFARAVLAPYKGIKYIVIGGQLPSTKFARISLPHGLSTYDALDQQLRMLGSFPITSDEHGNFVIVAGPIGGDDTITEGKDILEGREIIFNTAAEMTGTLPAVAQAPGSDKTWGAHVASVPFLNQEYANLSKGYLPLVIPLELPGAKQEFLQGRSSAERDWLHQDQITVMATIYGWLRPSGGLWQVGQMVRVISPMLVMDGSVALTAKSVTFTQDNATGTRTTLELMNEQALSQLPGLPAP